MKIKANELRIGNWVSSKCHNGLNTEIFAIRSSELIGLGANPLANYSLEEIEPIPLTEEWLLKFGFLYNGWNWDFQSFRFHAQGKNDRGEFYNTEFGIRKNKDFFIISFKIQYVHQLQNLYFALTGEELTIKL